MKAITVIEDDEGNVTTVASGSPCYGDGIELLHRAIAELLRASKGDHGSDI